MSKRLRRLWLDFVGWLVVVVVAAVPAAAMDLGSPPAGFHSADLRVNGTSLHYVRGGSGPAVVLLHGFPEDWVEYRAILPRLAKRFTVIAIDLPGIGKSAPPNGGYGIPNVAAQIHALTEALKLRRTYLVGHDVGGHVAYAYVRQFPDSLRGAMILDVPMPGLAGSEEAGAGLWHVGFIMVPGLAEKLVPGRQDAFLGWFFDLGKFTRAERAYFARSYRAPQLHAAFQMYRAMPAEAKWNSAQVAPNNVPLTVAVGRKSLFTKLLPKFAEGYRAKGMTNVETAIIPSAGHYVVADNPEAVAELVEQHAGSRQ
jgi:pimeloyl-ACP methyl ester carboxylesterase